MDLVVQPHGGSSLGDVLRGALTGEIGAYHSLTAAVAFVRRSGVQHIRSELRTFVAHGGHVLLIVGVDQRGTSVEGLSDLLAAVGDTGEIWVNHDEDPYITFHPKVYLFEGEESALLIVGSGNLTLGGLYRNDEVSSVSMLDLMDEGDAAELAVIKEAFNAWCDEESETARRLDPILLQALQDGGYVVLEAMARSEGTSEAGAAGDTVEALTSAERVTARQLFGHGEARRMPRRPTGEGEDETAPAAETIDKGERLPRGFVMTLMRTDVGTGQTTPEASRRSPEIFVPLGARDRHPRFWGWDEEFTEDPRMSGKLDRRGVPMRLGGETIDVNMMTWPVKHDFRLRSETLRSAGTEGDILRIEKADQGADFDYYVEIVPPGTTAYEYYRSLCTQPTPNSDRMWGYYND